MIPYSCNLSDPWYNYYVSLSVPIPCRETSPSDGRAVGGVAMYILAPAAKRRRGFTIAEMMVVVAILAILAALAIPGILSTQRLLHMKELDNCAQELFLTAQNRLTAQKSSGSVAQLTHAGPGQDRSVQGVSALADYAAYYLTEETIGELLPRESLASALQSNYFYVLYDADSASVLTVLYSTTPFAYQTGYNVVGLGLQARIQADLWIGWYNGTPASSEDILQLDAPIITIQNGEKLIAEITVTTPSAAAAPLSDIDLKVSIGDISLPVGTPVPTGARSQTYTVILDSLAPGEPRFRDLSTGVAPGEGFTLRAWATSSAGQDSTYNYATDNSLFASGSGGGTAYIACGRHLQNLDQGSGVTDAVIRAVQTADVRFDDTGEQDSWYACYTEANVPYMPITNPDLLTYDGYHSARLAQTTITGLSAHSVSQAGLFAAFSGSGLYNIWLVNPAFSASGSAGGLAAVADGDALTVENCQVYHAYSHRTVQQALGSYTNAQISAPTAGGLVGRAQGSLNIKNSLAATLIQSGTLAGGLVGSVAGPFDITDSYADCYLSGQQVGGLVGRSTLVGAVTTSYAAGFVWDSSIAAGIACGPGRVQVSDSYSAMSYLSAQDVYPLVANGIARSAYYLSVAAPRNDVGEACSADQLQQTALSARFAPATGSSTRPYDLMDGMALTVYPFPQLTGMIHYGDWQSEFESEDQADYEDYDGGSSFSGDDPVQDPIGPDSPTPLDGL